jgi:hypothetical protein
MYFLSEPEDKDKLAQVTKEKRNGTGFQQVI